MNSLRPDRKAWLTDSQEEKEADDMVGYAHPLQAAEDFALDHWHSNRGQRPERLNVTVKTVGSDSESRFNVTPSIVACGELASVLHPPTFIL